MNDIREVADLFDKILKDKKLEKYTYVLIESEKQELNVENGEFKLMRTVFDYYTSLTVYKDNKMGSASGNDLSREALIKLAVDSESAADSSPEDPCHDFAPDQGKSVFRQGTYEPDMDRFLDRIQECLDTIKKEYPKVLVMSAVGSYDRNHWISRNTNGTEFEDFTGQYNFNFEISASDEGATSGIGWTSVTVDNLDTPFINLGDLRQSLEDISNSIHPKSLEGKFEGTVILTPSAASQFLGMLISNYMSDTVVINGTSLWLNKVGEQVASEKLTVSKKPFDDRIVCGERATQDGFISEDVTLIEKGVLKTHSLSLYAANKTGRPVVKNTGWSLVVEPGEKKLSDMIRSVDKGLILGGFSGGEPGANGEFSGVAKNSFYIENGEVKYALSETMVNGNLGDIVKNIRDISKEVVCDGGSVVPYIAVDGVVISGK
ncbi:PmbA protein [Butyrivibrio fibrisolvens]|uniref:PmbA protein n=1 Tax=Butyrivibrio fibrisolvens TaxID=831 RepID=A0A1H9QKY5_BUTFI|nr:metallopeptidase TldD-related protein [Butyrivibrio fibrisolvens]SER61098.1 PmbA protein [Butyrivibrio fibrisolvens]